MKINSLWIFAGIVLLTVAGCASSERMMRISGGVVDEYSAPASYRIRSKKFQAVNRKFSTPERAAKSGITDFDKPLVNLWPFYFRSDEYISALWPMIDYDPYGIAVRPFYNQEGDEYSVLFPLSAWNPESRSGWILNAVWEPGKFLFLPLAGAWKDPEMSGGFIAPFAWWSRDLRKLGWDEKSKSLLQEKAQKTVILPVVWRKKSALIPGEYQWLYRWRGYSGWKHEMRYHLTRKNLPVPETEAEIRELQKRIAVSLPERQWTQWGILPLLLVDSDRNGGKWIGIFPLLTEYQREGERVSLDVMLSLLGKYDHLPLGPIRNAEFPDTGWKKIRCLLFYRNQYWEYDLGKDRHLVQELLRHAAPSKRESALRYLKQLDPSLTLPETVVEWNTMKLYLNEIFADRKYPVRESSSWGVFPLFFAGSSREDGYWAAPALLSWAMWGNDHSFRAALPLLSMQSKEAYSGWTTIFTPLAYFQKYHKSAVPEESRIAPPESLYPIDTVSSADTYAGCGLFYRGRVKFYAGKDAGTWKTLDKVQCTLLKLAQQQQQLHRRRSQLDQDLQKLREWKPEAGDKVDAARRNLRQAELEVQEENWQKDQQKLQTQFQELQILAEKLDMRLTDSELQQQDVRRKFLRKMLETHAVLREKEDIGSGFFFRRENFWNGDYHWRLFCGLAGGMKKGDCETEHILHFLYRKRQENDRSEVIFFPFVSIQEDGARRRVSFLGRIWQRTTGSDGAAYGYCCFIPFGEDPENRK